MEQQTDIETTGFSTFYRREHDGQVRRAYLLLGTSALAHDVVADAFLAVLTRWDSIDDPGPYLNRCVLNGCRDVHRRGRPEHLVAEPIETDGNKPSRPITSIVDHTADVDESDEMTERLLNLPFRQRAAIVLRYYGGHDETEIATYLECRPGTVGSLIHRGLRSLRLAIGDDTPSTADRPRSGPVRRIDAT